MLVGFAFAAASVMLPTLEPITAPAVTPASSQPTGAAASAPAPTTQPAPGGAALMPYADPTFGFELQVPAGWAYDRSRFSGPHGSIGILSGRNAGGQVALQVLVFRTADINDFSAWLTSFQKRLREVYGGRNIAEQHSTTETGARATLFVDMGSSGSRTQTYYLCIPFDVNTVWVLVLAAPVATPADEELFKAEFNRIADSVRVLYNPLDASKIAAAFDRGIEVLKELRAGAASVELDETERYYDILIAGKSIGYLSRWARRAQRTIGDRRYSRDVTPGLRVHEEVWRFAEDGTVRQTELDMFSSSDLKKELIENRRTQVPAPDVPSQRLYIELDQCVREGNALVSSFSTNIATELPDPRPPLPIGPRYLDLAWVRLLPQLLLRAPSETYAFAIYDSETRGLIICTIQPLGAFEVPGPRGGRTCLFETREGFVSQPSHIYTDEAGQVVRVESGDMAIVLTTREEVERRYAERRESARRKMTPASRP